MAFNDILQEVVNRCGGGFGAVMVGFDGIVVDGYLAEGAPLDLQVVSAEYAPLLKSVRGTVNLLKGGNLEEVTVSSDQSCVLVRTIDQDYFVALVLGPEGNVGKGRYLLQRAALQLREELE